MINPCDFGSVAHETVLFFNVNAKNDSSFLNYLITRILFPCLLFQEVALSYLLYIYSFFCDFVMLRLYYIVSVC